MTVLVICNCTDLYTCTGYVYMEVIAICQINCIVILNTVVLRILQFDSIIRNIHILVHGVSLLYYH